MRMTCNVDGDERDLAISLALNEDYVSVTHPRPDDQRPTDFRPVSSLRKNLAVCWAWTSSVIDQ